MCSNQIDSIQNFLHISITLRYKEQVNFAMLSVSEQTPLTCLCFNKMIGKKILKKVPNCPLLTHYVHICHIDNMQMHLLYRAEIKLLT